MIPASIQAVHHVSPTNQVPLICFVISLIYLHLDSGARFQYSGPPTSLRSTLTITPNSLPANQTYQFMLQMTNRRNSSLQSTGYLLVNIEDSSPPFIALA